MHALRFYWGAYGIAGPGKTESQDAWIASQSLLGVFDGVGGAANSGVYARQMADASLAAVQRASLVHADASVTMLRDCLQEAHAAVTVPGACTATLVALDARARLHTLCIGDSRYCVIRAQSRESTLSPCSHTGWQTRDGRAIPRQLSAAQHAALEVQQAALKTVTQLEPGDVLVLGSDGLFDNLSEQRIKDMVLEPQFSIVSAADRQLVPAPMPVEGAQVPPRDPAAVAYRLVLEARRANLHPDDITAVVAYLVAVPERALAPVTPSKSQHAPANRKWIIHSNVARGVRCRWTHEDTLRLDVLLREHRAETRRYECSEECVAPYARDWFRRMAKQHFAQYTEKQVRNKWCALESRYATRQYRAHLALL